MDEWEIEQPSGEVDDPQMPHIGVDVIERRTRAPSVNAGGRSGCRRGRGADPSGIALGRDLRLGHPEIQPLASGTSRTGPQFSKARRYRAK
jgi:hypothetical protein